MSLTVLFFLNRKKSEEEGIALMIHSPEDDTQEAEDVRFVNLDVQLYLARRIPVSHVG